MSYVIGQTIRLRAQFTDPEAEDALVEPDVVTIKVQNPSGTETSHEPTLDASTTTYFYDLELTAPGLWYYRAECSGGYAAANEGSFTVRTSQFD